VSLAAAKAGQQPVRRKERVYLGDFEVYREFQADGTVPKLERETLHIIDDQQRMARVETTTKESGLMGRLRSFLRGPPAFIRYTLGNHLGSASLELDEAAKIVSYEEYTPFGSTSYQALGSQTESARRYRYSGKERDDATGLYYYGARYYAPWLGRWMSADPAGTVDGLNLFAFVRGNPVTFIDHLGLCGGRAGPKPERRNALPPIKVPKKDREGDGHSAMMVRHTFERRDSEGEWETHSARMAAPLVKQAEDAKLNGMLLEYRERVAAPKGLQGFLLEHINLHRDKFKVSPGQGAILGKPALLSKLKTQVEKIDYGMAISLSSRAAGRNADARRTDDKSVIDNVARETDAIAPELGNSGEIRQAIALFLLKAHFVAIADSLAPSRIFSLGAKDEEKEDPKTLRAFVQRGKEMAKDKAKEIASDLFKRVVEQLAVRVLGSVL
jgi:RHS repeat-associated protein